MIHPYKRAFARDCLALALFIVSLLAPQALWAGAEEKENSEAALGALAEKYWTKRMVEKDYQATYKYELEKESIPFEEYSKQISPGQKFDYLSVKTKKVEINGDRGAVYLEVECNTTFVKGKQKLPLQDLWLYRSGEWKHKFVTR